MVLVPPQKLKQRYRILRKVAQGGFGIVYEAEDILFRNRRVAVKEMSQSGLSQQKITEAADAFEGEAFMLASLEHQNLPKIHDYFKDVGDWYLVMDFIDGDTLQDYLDTQGGKLPPKDVLEIGIR